MPIFSRPATPRVLSLSLVAASLVAASLVGCAERAPDRLSSVSRDTVDGVLVVTNEGAGTWADDPDSRWIVGEARLRIGTVEGDGPDLFGSIAAIAVDGDRIYVADGDALEVRAFDLNGSFLLAFGANGEGPGEFGAIDGLVVEPGGSLAVRDPRLGRVSRFDRDGGFLSSFRLERSFFVFSDGTTLWADRSGRLYDRVPLNLGMNDREAIGLIPYSDGVAQDTIRVLEYEPPRVVATQGGRTVMTLFAPFVVNPGIAVGPGGRIAAAEGSTFRIERIPAGDGMRAEFRRALEPPPVAASARDGAVEALRARVEEMAPGATVADVPIPNHEPAYARLIADSEGCWWAGRYRAERDPEDPSAALPVEYDVFDPEGVYLGTVDVPPILIMSIGADFIAGKETDALGVDYAVVLPLERPAGRPM